MEYDLFNSWEDKMQMLTATNSIIDELGLANKISKVKVQSAAMENINKVNILRDMRRPQILRLCEIFREFYENH